MVDGKTKRGGEKSEWNDLLLLLFFRGFPAKPIPLFFSIFGISHTKRFRALSLSLPGLILTRKRYLGFFEKLWRDIQLQNGQQTHKIPTESSCALCCTRAAQHNNPFAAAVATQNGPGNAKARCVRKKRGGRRKDLINPPLAPPPYPGAIKTGVNAQFYVLLTLLPSRQLCRLSLPSTASSAHYTPYSSHG